MSSNYYHGARAEEKATSVVKPDVSTSGLQVVIGTAPVNRIRGGGELVNRPVLAYDYEEAVSKLGYSEDWQKYTLCQSMYATFKLVKTAPIILINVLDVGKDCKAVAAGSWNCRDNEEYRFTSPDIIADSIVVKTGETTLEEGTDYVVTMDDDGFCILSVLPGTTYTSLTVEAKEVSFDRADMIQRVVGGYSAPTGKNLGISAVNDVYPMFQMAPGLILAPGWSQEPAVSAALTAANTNISGKFSANSLVDVDCSSAGAVKCEDFKKQKEAQYLMDKNTFCIWPKIRAHGMDFYATAVYGAAISAMDAGNQNVPCLSPSNLSVNIQAAVLEGGTEVMIPEHRANNYINRYGGVTVINNGGWKLWGNNTSLYPDTSDPKDRWICCRRFFNYYRNRLLVYLASKVDRLADFRLIESICDEENVWFNAMKDSLYIAGGKIRYLADDNPVDNVLDGHLRFRISLATFTPAEDIAAEIEYDKSILEEALGGE